MLAYWYCNEDMTAGHGNEPSWAVGEKRSLKGKLTICKYGYHSSPSPSEGLKYIGGPILCLVEIGKPIKPVAGHEDKFLSRSRQLIKYVDLSIPLRLLMCDIADTENARYEAENPGKKVPVEAINSVLAGRKFAAGEITAEEMATVNRVLSYSCPYYYSYSSYSSSYSRYPHLFEALNRLALEALEKA